MPRPDSQPGSQDAQNEVATSSLHRFKEDHAPALIREHHSHGHAPFVVGIVNPHHVPLQLNTPFSICPRRLHRDLQFGLQLRQMRQRNHGALQREVANHRLFHKFPSAFSQPANLRVALHFSP